MKMDNYTLERILFKAAGLDDFAHYLLNELDKLDAEKATTENILPYLEVSAVRNKVKEIRDVYNTFKRTGKLPESVVRELKLSSEIEELLDDEL